MKGGRVAPHTLSIALFKSHATPLQIFFFVSRRTVFSFTFCSLLLLSFSLGCPPAPCCCVVRYDNPTLSSSRQRRQKQIIKNSFVLKNTFRCFIVATSSITAPRHDFIRKHSDSTTFTDQSRSIRTGCAAPSSQPRFLARRTVWEGQWALRASRMGRSCGCI